MLSFSGQRQGCRVLSFSISDVAGSDLLFIFVLVPDFCLLWNIRCYRRCSQRGSPIRTSVGCETWSVTGGALKEVPTRSRTTKLYYVPKDCQPAIPWGQVWWQPGSLVNFTRGLLKLIHGACGKLFLMIALWDLYLLTGISQNIIIWIHFNPSLALWFPCS